MRVFKSAWFAKASRKARISDAELCQAVRDAMAGLADDLGGGVFKKRLDNNQYRSIILAKAGHCWVFEYLFAKSERSNIDAAELADFRILAKGYAGLSASQISQLLQEKLFVEICNDQTKIQE